MPLHNSAGSALYKTNRVTDLDEGPIMWYRANHMIRRRHETAVDNTEQSALLTWTTSLKCDGVNSRAEGEAIAYHGRWCWRPPSSPVDTGRSTAHHQQQATCRCKLLSPQSLCCDTGDTLTDRGIRSLLTRKNCRRFWTTLSNSLEKNGRFDIVLVF